MSDLASPKRRLRRDTFRRLRRAAGWAGMLLALGLVASASVSVTAGDNGDEDHEVAGAGKTIIEGGTGAPAFIPVTTILAFHARGQSGTFECLALAPHTATGAESGEQAPGTRRSRSAPWRGRPGW
jgi:hypothetical protein